MYKVAIPLRQIFKSSSLVTRQAARQLMQILDSKKVKTIALDFADIHYASRSFFDELSSYQKDFEKKNNKLIFINLSEELNELNEFVTHFQRSSSKYESISSADRVAI